MFNFQLKLFKILVFIIFRKRKDVIFTFLLLKKENEIMKRYLNLSGKKTSSNHSGRFLSITHCSIIKTSNFSSHYC